MKVKNIGSKALSVILAILMILYSIPLMSFASLMTSEDDTMLGQEFKTEDNVIEITELREEDVKHFRLSDGTYIAAQYKTAVHYLDDNGMWQDIDNSLSEIDGDISTSNSRVKFSKKITGNERIFTLKNGSYKITFSLEDAAKGTPITVSNDGKTTVKAATKFEELSTLSKITSSVRYNDILPGIDLEYLLLGNTLKENILINKKQDSYVYTFELSLNNLTAELTDEGSILLLTEKDEILYQMPAPYMYDAAGEYSDEVIYSLTKSGNGKYLLTITADSEWINTEKRAFPVTIDPTIDVIDSADISDTYQDSGSQTVNHGGESYLYVGNKGGKTQYTLISMNNLPTLPAGSMVTEAELRLQITGCNLTGKRTVLMQKVNVPQVLSGITWNTQVEYTEEAYDYEEVDANTTYCYFNLAKMYHEWSEDGGKILRLSMVGSSSQHTNYVMFASSNNTSSDVITPYFELTYVNTLGIEDYYSYRTQSAGDAGTVYIGDHTGQLTLSRTDAVSDNTALSASVGHVYNSALASGDYSVKDASGNDLLASMKIGAGFMLSSQQTLMVHTSGETYCEYRDGDGTIHYLRCSKTTSLGFPIEYADTDGMGLTVVDPTESNFANKYSLFADFGFEYSKSLLLMDQKGSCWLFYNGLPAMFVDSNGNLIKYLYNTTSSSGTAWFPTAGSGNALRAIVQNNKISETAYSSNITLATFTYSGGYLNTIVTPGRTLYFVYQTYNSQKLLTKVTVSETVNTSNSYSYTLAEYGYTNGMLTTVYDTERQYGIKYTYDSSIQKYTGYYEFAGTMSSYTRGEEYTVVYKAGQTEFTCCGAQSDNSDDIIYVSVLDNYGRTVNSYIKDVNGTIYSATAGAYTYADDFSKNHIADTSSIGMTGANLLVNPSMETNASFSNSWIRSNGNNITCSTEVVHNGTHSVKMQFSDTLNYSLNIAQNVTPPTSGQYCFSVYVNMSEMLAVNSAANGGVVLQVYNIETGAVTESTLYTGNYVGSDYIPTDPNKEWHRIHVIFTAEADTQYEVRILGKDMYGALYVDDAQLEKGSTVGAYNLLSMQLGSSSEFGWIFDPASVTQGLVAHEQLQTPIVFSNFSDTPKIITVSQKVTGVKGKGFTLSGWTATHAVPEKAEEVSERFLGLRATVDYVKNATEDGTELQSEVYYIPFNAFMDELQYACGTVIPGHYEECNITVEIVYKNNINSAKFYAISLAESDAIGYTYDSKGNMLSTTKAGLEKSVYQYDSISNNLTSFANGTIRTDITYDEEQNGYLPSTVTTQGITSEFTYDRAGNVTGTVLRPEGTMAAATIHTASTFDARLAKLTASTDERGNVTSYTYNADGSVKSVTLDNVETEYLYGKKGRQRRIMIDSLASVEYSYTGGNLTGITTGGIFSSGSLMSYHMTYDAFGRTLSVRVGNETLASYTYEAKTGYLLTMTYGNGSTLRYEYDILGRTKSVYQDEMLRFLYEYDGAGNLYKLTDQLSSIVYIYRYDSVCNLTAEEQYNLSNNGFLQGQYYTYNSYGDLACSTLQIAGMDPIRYVCSYDYETTGGKTSLVDDWKAIGTGYKVDYAYDGLDRISRQWYRQDTAVSVDPVLTKNYSYLSNPDGTTTTLVSGIQYGGYTSRNYSYTYDNLGNITEVYNGTTLEASYTYDDLGQLTRENNKTANKTYVYTYDDRGNITSRKIYAYTTGALGAVKSTDSYGYYQQYDTEMWGDVLKSYNGTMFSYDAIGNPLTYYNGASYTFNWMRGRTLTSGTKGNVSFSYSYNTDGLRTQKIVGNQTYTYYWNGSQLAMMTVKTGNNTITLKFYYDAEGVPFYFDYNGTKYFYITNLQGDVVGIANSNGIVGYYEYDAWGKVLTYNGIGSTDYSAITYNPLRYRGYIYDTETGFYYLQTRYYDPSIGRFINADGYVSTGTGFLGYNMYAYCNNNPVMLCDHEGNFPWLIAAIITVAAIVVVSTVVNHIVNAINIDNIEDEIEETYTQETAKQAINEINSEVNVDFNDNKVIIENSRKVTSRYDRQKICMIIDRTVELEREVDNMSSEWLMHNIMYACHVKRENADPADLEYDKDSRWYVRAATKFLEVLGWE